MNHQVESMLKVSLDSIKDMVNVDAIVGKPIISTQDVMVIPVSKVKLGFASGGSDFKGTAKNENPFGGATGGSVSILPIAFLVITKDEVKIMHLQNETHLYEKLIDKIPEVAEYVNKSKSI